MSCQRNSTGKISLNITHINNIMSEANKPNNNIVSDITSVTETNTPIHDNKKKKKKKIK